MTNRNYYLILLSVICASLRTEAITKTREADILNLNGIQDGDTTSPRGIGKGAAVSKDAAVTESQENRSFFKPSDADRRGSFYPSGPPGTSSGFGPNYHASGNGYSYGSSSGSEYPNYGSSYPIRPTTSISSHGSYGAGLGGNYPLSPSSGHGGGLPSGHGGGLPSGHGGGPPQHPASALKSLLLPIAGVALLGAAAVLAKSHPVLLQLGVVGHGKRRRRSLGIESNLKQGIYPENPFIKAPSHKIVKKNF